ncbi:MAG: 5-(carboxyamino)imidazole ribonucleotide synthase [Alphaproteobacteria bacterium]|nr:5-(carboxyamino)imidazole ribonucleotide synthase [Alphaproteobacteria bacterium]
MNHALPPGSTIGILGGGQLGRMMAMAAAEMGYHVHIYCPEKDCPAAEVAHKTTVAAYDDAAAMAAFAKSVDVVTYEFENIPAAPVEKIAAIVPVRPSPSVLSTSQHRTLEKTAIQKLGIKTAPFAPVKNVDDLKIAVQKIGLPAVLKTATMGYDGKGQWKILSAEELPAIPAGDYVLEGFINFRMEISVIVARDVAGNIACYCPVENIHKNHILDQTIAPARIFPQLAEKAENIAKKIAEGFGLVGLLAIEMFVTDDDEILVNETAPRPHNSGHWTMDACITSQFTQVIRAVCGLPLGNPERLCDARMLNLIGDDAADWQKHAATPNAKLHLYGKKEARAGRKMGHVTFLEIAPRK